MSEELKLERTREQWEKCDPEAMSRMSQAAIFYALRDAKRDMIAMHAALASNKAAPSDIGGPMLDSVKPLVDAWIRSRGTCMDGESYFAALQLAAHVAAAQPSRAEVLEEVAQALADAEFFEAYEVVHRMMKDKP